ncbi:MAG TPA: nucleotidyltransferase family protein [Gemmatimonadaceae bacterium]|nr:nucleotidyltransferase family protein [Gemmatimonadaceae bacterium]
MIAAVVLAAGASSRFAGHKLLATLYGAPVVHHAVQAALAMPVDEVVVVLGRDPAAVRAAVGSLPARFVEHAAFADGMGGSLAAGIAALSPGTAAALVLLGDQPTVRPEAGAALVAAWHGSRAPVVVPEYEEAPGQRVRGHPVLFDASVFADLRGLRGDAGARGIIAAHADRVVGVPVDGPPPPDVDTPGDLARLSRNAESRS